MIDATCIDYVVGAGLAGPDKLRAVIILTPGVPGPTGERAKLETWPSFAHGWMQRHQGQKLTLRQGPLTHELDLFGTGDALNQEELHAIDALWARAMAPTDDWTGVLEAFRGVDIAAGAGPAPKQHTQRLPLPTAEAALAVPLERGRKLLDMLAGPDSPLLARMQTRPPPSRLAAAGRPWLNRPGALTRLAALDHTSLTDAERTILLGPPDVAAWLAARAAGDTDGAGAGDAAFTTPLDPHELERDALGANGRTMLAVFDRMHALHHTLVAATGAPVAQSSPSCIFRVTHLLASPALMRLFGLAFDVVVHLDPAVADGVWNVTFPGADAVKPCAIRLDRAGHGFYPATRAEAGVPAANPPFEREEGGILHLGDAKAYALTSLEAGLGASADYAKQAAGCTDHPTADPAATPHSGGIALVQLGGVPDNSVSADTDPNRVLCSEDLRTFRRLDVGLVVDGPNGPATAWRSVMRRNVGWSDPAGKVDIEAVLRRLLDGPPGAPLRPCALPRTELEAGTVTRATVVQKKIVRHDARVAIYNGYPGGEAVNQVWWKDGKPHWGHEPLQFDASQALPLSQNVTIPSGAPGITLPPLRFGWSYRIGLRTVWLGGVTRPVEEAAAQYDHDPSAAIPSQDGQPYLRHEPLAAPAVFLPEAVPAPRPSSPFEDRLQTAKQAVVVTWPDQVPKGHRAVPTTTRIILPSPVSLEFAALHEVFDGPVKMMTATLDLSPPAADPAKQPEPVLLQCTVPADGLQHLRFEGSATFLQVGDAKVGGEPYQVAQGDTPRVSVLHNAGRPQRPSPYYPDPACFLAALALRDPVTNALIGRPTLVTIRSDSPDQTVGRWPDLLPVRVELAAAPQAGRHLRAAPGPVTGVWSAATSKPVQFMDVCVQLGPGEEAELDIWLVPSLDDLAAWFDVCDAAARLAQREAADSGCQPSLQSLLGQAASSGTDDIRRQVASLVWAQLAERPVELVSRVRSIRLLHAVAKPRSNPALPAPQLPLTLTRRLDVSKEAVASFLSGSLGRRGDEDGAIQPVIRGRLALDLATTSGVLIEARVAAPDDSLDVGSPADDPALVPLPPQRAAPAGPDGVAKFTYATVQLLRIEGIPPPKDGQLSPQVISLDDLQKTFAEPVAARAGFAQLQVVRGSPFRNGGARKVDLLITAIPRHAEMLGFKQDPKQRLRDYLEIKNVWLAATIRPAEPDPRDLWPIFDWTDLVPTVAQHQAGTPWTWTRTRISAFRVELRRPWFVSGEGEQLGILLWPPVLPIGAMGQLDPFPSDKVMAALLEDDIGPLGPFVSAWGRDILRSREGGKAPTRFPLRREHLIVKGADDPGSEECSTVLVPIAGGQIANDLDNEAVASVLRVTPLYDAANDVWYAEVRFAEDLVRDMTDRTVRLGLVRFQPNARPDFERGPADRGIHCSPPAAAWGVLLPRRELCVTLQRLPGPHPVSMVTVQFSGPGDIQPARVQTHTTDMRRLQVSITLVDTAQDREAIWEEKLDVEAKPIPFTADLTWTAAFTLNHLKPADVLSRFAVQVLEREMLPSAHSPQDKPADPDGPVRYFARVDLAAG